MKKQLIHIMPRTGSTMVRQILKELVPNKYIATHKFVEGEDSLIITIRDFRDVFISLWRIWFSKDNEGKITTKPEIGQIMNTIAKTKLQIDGLNKYKESYKNNKIIIWRYEDYYNNPDYIINQIEKIFNITVKQDKRDEISGLCSIDKNKEIQKKVEVVDKKRIFNNYDGESGIHSNHISYIEPKQGYWKKIVDKKFHKLIESLLDKDLKEWDYK